MIPLPQKPKVIQKKGNMALFEIAGLYPGYGVTLGNCLRRVLLSSLEGAAITQVKIKGVSHEFSTIAGVLEDVVILLLNLKKLRFRSFAEGPRLATLVVKGEKGVKGKDFKLPADVKLSNPDEHIATLTKSSAELNMEVQIERGVGYEPVEIREAKKPEVGVIHIDAIFTPVKKVNFSVENMRVGKRTDFDLLRIEVETDGTISPEQAMSQSSEILLKHFSLVSEGLPKEKPVSLPDLTSAKAEARARGRKEKPKAKKKKEIAKEKATTRKIMRKKVAGKR